MKEKLISDKLIAVSGVKGSGKDSVANIIQYCLSVPKIFRQYWIYKCIRHCIHYKHTKLAFADPLKRMLAVLLNTPYEDFNNRSFKECYSVDLETLGISYATGSLSDSKFNRMVKELDPELSKSMLSVRQLMQYFGTQVMQTYFGRNVWINSTLKNASDHTIITDLRFKAEAEAVHNLGGIIFYVSRPGYTFGQHASEREMSELLSKDQFDFVIENDGSQEDLFNKVKEQINTIKWLADK